MKRVRPALLGLALALAAVALYAWQIEPSLLGVTRLELPPDLRAPLAGKRLVLISDLHITADWRHGPRLFATLDRLAPDYILIAGDLVWYERDTQPVIDVIRKFRAREGVYAVLGDADYTGRVRNCVYCHVPGTRELRHDLPVRFLRNEAVPIADGRVTLLGLDVNEMGAWDDVCRANLDDGKPSITLVHFPSALSAVAKVGSSIVLAGHTHGGQVCAPSFVYPYFGEDKVKENRYGWFQRGRTPMFVTRGVGESILPVRLGEPPEVVLLEGK